MTTGFGVLRSQLLACPCSGPSSDQPQALALLTTPGTEHAGRLLQRPWGDSQELNCWFKEGTERQAQGETFWVMHFPVQAAELSW